MRKSSSGFTPTPKKAPLLKAGMKGILNLAKQQSPGLQAGVWGFTLIEMMVVVVIIGILASVALPRYVVIVEKGRSAEARDILGQILAAERVYYFERDCYTINRTDLSLDIPAACNTSYYYNYSITGGGSGFMAIATRCTSGGKSPDSPSGASIIFNLTQDGFLNGTVPFL